MNSNDSVGISGKGCVKMWNNVITLFREYMGTGLIVIWFLISLVYLFLREKRKQFRILFVYVPMILLLLFFNPLFAKIIYLFVDDEIYYRILWLLPITMVTAFAAADIYGHLKGRTRFVYAAAAACLIMVSGSYIYSNPFFQKAENRYHIPQTVVDICDAIQVEGREVMAVFPAEMLQYVRQYTETVRMPYGREQTVDRWNQLDELYLLMEADEIDVDRLVPLARERWCAYIILPEDKKAAGDFAAHSFEVFGEIDGYVIYRDSTADLAL